MDETLRLLIPVLAISIPVIAVAGRYIVTPLVEALSKRDLEDGSPRVDREEMDQLRDRVEGLEKALARVTEEQEFQKALQGRGESS